MSLDFCLISNLIFLFFFFISVIKSSDPTIKDLRSSIGNANDLIKVGLGISEDNPNSRASYYIDVNNDK
jgi:hypothetical protein